ncbi:MAG TPA: tetratricopeptide repeat protein [Patescibacteria group bacterium]|nr:tetratricopeptide repeat protein [Patescibacteria group bacterium]
MTFKIDFLLKATMAAFTLVLLSCGSTPSGTPAREITRNIFVTDTAALNKKARQFFIQGSAFEMQERYAEAIVEFHQALRNDSSAVIFYALAKNYLELSKNSQTPKLDEALEYSREATHRNPLFVPALEITARIFMAQYKFSDAIPVYERIVQLEPTRTHRFTLARLYEYQNMDKAIAEYEKLSAEEEDYSVLYRLTEIYRQTGRQEALTRTLLKMMTLTPDNPAIGENIFQTYLSQKNFLKAQELLTQFESQIAGEDLNRYYTLYGSALIQAGDSLVERRNLAQTFLLKVDSYGFADWRTLLTAGFVADAIKNENKAENFFKKATIAADTIADVPVQIALHYIQSDKFSQAAEFLKTHEKSFPKDWRVPFFLGVAHSRLGNNDQAINALNRSAKIDSTIADTWIQLGLLHDEMGNHKQSDAAYEHALAIDPDNALANNNYAYSLSQRDMQLDRALRMIGIAYKAEPNNASYLDTYGWILYKLRRYEEALTFIEKAVAAGDVSAAVFEHLGDVYIKLSNKEKAREAWEKSLQKDPNRDSARERLNTIR